MPEKESGGLKGVTLGRPKMPAGYGIMPENEGRGLFPWRYVCVQMEEARNYWVGTVGKNGRAHIRPVWGIWLAETFYFGTDPQSATARNLASSPALSVHLESGDEVVILEGRAEKTSAADLIKKINQAYLAKYQVNVALTEAVALKAEVAFAWLETDFPGSATRWQFE